MNAALDSMRCDDVERMVHPYLDGELIENDVVTFDSHVGGCAACRRLLDDELRFKATLRAHLRPAPTAPAELRERVLAGLDQADSAGDGPTAPLFRRVMPFVAVFAAAASMVVFLSSIVQTRAGRTAIVEDAIRSHEKHLPVEVGGDAEHVTSWMAGKVSVPVRPPQLSRVRRGGAVENAALVGGRLGHVSGHDAGQLTYRLGPNFVTEYVFDASNLTMSAPKRRVVDNHELFVDSERGYSVVFFRDERDMGYVFVSDLDEDQLVGLVAATLE